MSGEIQQKETDHLSLIDTLDRVGVETLVALVQCATQKEAAAALNITYQALWLRMKKYKLDLIMSELPKQALSRLHLGSLKAADTMVRLTEEAKDDKVKLEASKEVLDRVGIIGKPDVAVQTVTQFNLPDTFGSYDKVSSESADNSGGPPPVQGS